MHSLVYPHSEDLPFRALSGILQAVSKKVPQQPSRAASVSLSELENVMRNQSILSEKDC